MSDRIKAILNRLFSTSAAGVYMILFAIAIGLATFIENDFGTNAAQKVIFKSRWFELLLILFGISIMVNIFRFKMIKQKKWAILLFHASIIIILIGAAATRYLGSEGIMHIREGDQSNLILSNETYLQFEVKKDGQTYHFDEKVLFASLGKNKFNESYQIGDQLINVTLDDFIPNPVEQLEPGQHGQSMLKVVIAGTGGREEHLIKQGEKTNLSGILFNFGNDIDRGAINIRHKNDSLQFISDYPLTQMVMATQQIDTLLPGTFHNLRQRSLYSSQMGNFVITAFESNATTSITAGARKMEKGSPGLVDLRINVNGEEEQLKLKGSAGSTGQPAAISMQNLQIKAAYGAKYFSIPFALRLRDFIMEKYPGTQSASSYASEVTLVDQGNGISKDHRIFMNNILNYGGYRFFQSSFDQDEKGTVLSVNHDAIGTWISYLGYFLLTLGMVLTLFSKKSRFYQVSQKLKEMRLKQEIATVAVGLLLSTTMGMTEILANTEPDAGIAIEEQHAREFGEVVVQDFRGRMKPLHTLANEVVRKLSRKQSLYGQTHEQVFLGMMLWPDKWADVPLITLGRNPEIKELVKVSTKLASYNDFFKPEYILREQVRRAYNMEAKERGTFEKEIIRIDERVNICNMVFTGQLMRLFPTTQTSTDAWLSLAEVNRNHAGHQVGSEIARFFPEYADAARGGNWPAANQMLDRLRQYQEKFGGHLLPSDTQIQAEVLLNKMNVFSRVGNWYALLGLLILLMFFVLIFKPGINPKWPLLTAQSLLGICFLLHTIGLGLRWYVSGRAPWSNGYESMIYIGWTTMLAGLIFTRRSLGGLAATSILSATILMVAGLSWMDPEITPLVPVLKSYWLTIHVSLEAGSYGFLMLGAIIGVLNLILMIFTNPGNKKRIDGKIKELSLISEMTLIGGLFMISIGTYLGGVWANESWGRYWGWDAKETWALVTILVYAFILHMRFIPGLRGFYAFNVASLFGLASVIMTYFGVNYYLSGLHSYAAGDPVPIPSFVYYTIGILLSISLLALWKNRMNSPQMQTKKKMMTSSSN